MRHLLKVLTFRRVALCGDDLVGVRQNLESLLKMTEELAILGQLGVQDLVVVSVRVLVLLRDWCGLGVAVVAVAGGAAVVGPHLHLGEQLAGAARAHV